MPLSHLFQGAALAGFLSLASAPSGGGLNVFPLTIRRPRASDSVCVYTIAEDRMDIEHNLFQEVAALKDEILSYENLSVGWDGFDAKPASRDAVLAALELVRATLLISSVLPNPSMSGDREISLYWDNGSVYIDVLLYGEDEIYYYMKDGKQNKVKGSAKSVDLLTGVDSFRIFLKELEKNEC